MPAFGDESKKQKETVIVQLQAALDEAIKIFDFSIIKGRRPKEEQEQAFKDGATTKHWPDSLHNVLHPTDLARAVDLYPYPRPIWTDDLLKELTVTNGVAPTRSEVLRLIRDWARWYYLAGLLRGIAHMQGTELRQGCNWDSDSDFTDQNFDDIPHHEVPR
jgi:hypothetical protein